MAPPRSQIRDAAIAVGDKFYWTGVPCKNGHYSNRRTTTTQCITRLICTRIERAQSGYFRNYLAPKREETRAYFRQYYKKQAERDPEQFYAERRKNNRNFRQRHPKRGLADSRARQFAKMQRTPKWADLDAIKLFYEGTPYGMVVDHMVPLQGRTVSGLHVLNNLQHLGKTENLIKHNKFDDWGDVA